MNEFSPFGPDSMMWRINRERVVLLSGPAVAVLQVAHPQVARGVAAHSKFQTDAMGRLRRTLEAVYSVAFGSGEEVEKVRFRVARAHLAVQGEGYSAFDPDAQLWVLATLIMGSVNMYRRFVGDLTTSELDQFLNENARFGEVFGLDPSPVPKTWGEFQSYWETMTGGRMLGSHPLCAAVANAVIKPDAPWFLRSLSFVFRALTVEYLPRTLRENLKITPGFISGALWSTLDKFLPPLIRVAPAKLRYAPQYLKAAHIQRSRGPMKGTPEE